MGQITALNVLSFKGKTRHQVCVTYIVTRVSGYSPR